MYMLGAKTKFAHWAKKCPECVLAEKYCQNTFWAFFMTHNTFWQFSAQKMPRTRCGLLVCMNWMCCGYFCTQKSQQRVLAPRLKGAFEFSACEECASWKLEGAFWVRISENSKVPFRQSATTRYGILQHATMPCGNYSQSRTGCGHV